jgi:hypothetical protein
MICCFRIEGTDLSLAKQLHIHVGPRRRRVRAGWQHFINSSEIDKLDVFLYVEARLQMAFKVEARTSEMLLAEWMF